MGERAHGWTLFLVNATISLAPTIARFQLGDMNARAPPFAGGFDESLDAPVDDPLFRLGAAHSVAYLLTKPSTLCAAAREQKYDAIYAMDARAVLAEICKLWKTLE